MPRACTICSHPDRKTIDQMIEDREPYLRIATKFGLNDKTVASHGIKHVLPEVEERERQAQAQALERVMQFRDEVNLPLLEKSKYAEHRLWDDYWALPKPVDRMAVMREIQKQQAEQAKLTGAYTKEGENPNTIEKVLSSFTLWLEKNPNANAHQKADAIRDFASFGKVDEAELSRRAGVDVQVIEGTQ